MKQTALKLMHSGGAFAPFRFLNRNKVLILMYHRFAERAGGVSIAAADFESHLKYLNQHYNVVSLSEAVSQFRENGKAKKRTAVITIDDGYNDAYFVALPLLRKYAMPATLFVVTDFLDQNIWLWTDKLRYVLLNTQKPACEYQSGEKLITLQLTDRRSRFQVAGAINSCLKRIDNNEKDKAIEELAHSLQVSIPEIPTAEFAALNWDQARELEHGDVEIGSHTHTHPILTQIQPDRVRWELRKSKSRAEEMLQHEITLFCYPNGVSDDEIRTETKSSGYTSAVSAKPGLNGPKDDLFALRRIAADHDLPHFAQNTSGFEGLKNVFRFARSSEVS
jgi:peptidoglycan/xylan/chitin deacetylase (PgdA/CDA1 family)